MDSLCLKPGITVAGKCHVISGDKPTVSAKLTGPWGISFRHPLKSLWKRYDAVSANESVLVEEREVKDERDFEENENWVLKIMHVKDVWGGEKEIVKERDLEKRDFEREIVEERDFEGDGNWVSKIMDVRKVWGGEIREKESENGGIGENDEDSCSVDYEYDDGEVEFDRGSFSRFLRRVSLSEARLYARMSYLGNLAYCIHLIKPKNLLRVHGLRFVTSSLEKKEIATSADKEREPALAELEVQEETFEEIEKKQEQETKGSRISPAAAYHIAASAASYLHAQTKSLISFRSSKSGSGEELLEENCESYGNGKLTDEEMASLIATTDSMTAVVAAKEEVKQAVADDLNSTLSSPCEWYICDDDISGTRYFVIQGSETVASWQANLLFEPIQFEGFDVPVHRGIYEAAKGIYEQMLPEVRAHVKSHGDRATFRFTGHSLGGSLSLLINLMLLIRGEAPPSSLLPVITFGSPSIMCGGDRLLKKLGLPRHHVQSIAMHRDIVPRAFSCNYPGHVAELLKAVNGNFRNHPCLNNQKLLYAPMGEFLILQPDEKHSPNHELLPPGSGLYLLNCPLADVLKAEKQLRAAKSLFLNSPHPLEILSDRSAYGSDGTVQRDHDMNSYLKSVRSVIRQELNQIRRAKREQRRNIWWPLIASHTYDEGIVVNRPASPSDKFNFSGMLQTGTRSLKRFSRLVASRNMHLLVVLLLPARLFVLGTFGVIKLVS